MFPQKTFNLPIVKTTKTCVQNKSEKFNVQKKQKNEMHKEKCKKKKSQARGLHKSSTLIQKTLQSIKPLKL